MTFDDPRQAGQAGHTNSHHNFGHCSACKTKLAVCCFDTEKTTMEGPPKDHNSTPTTPQLYTTNVGSLQPANVGSLQPEFPRVILRSSAASQRTRFALRLVAAQRHGQELEEYRLLRVNSKLKESRNMLLHHEARSTLECSQRGEEDCSSTAKAPQPRKRPSPQISTISKSYSQSSLHRQGTKLKREGTMMNSPPSKRTKLSSVSAIVSPSPSSSKKKPSFSWKDAIVADVISKYTTSRGGTQL